MTYMLRFFHEIEEDIMSGCAWYESISPGLGEEFLRIFYAYTVEMTLNPPLYPGYMVNFVAVFSGNFHTPYTSH